MSTRKRSEEIPANEPYHNPQTEEERERFYQNLNTPSWHFRQGMTYPILIILSIIGIAIVLAWGPKPW